MEKTWYSVSAMWLLFLPGSFWVACKMLSLAGWTGMTAGVMVGFSSIVAGQVLNQNSASTLGIAIAPLTIALLATAIVKSPRLKPPVWLLALFLSGLVGCYSEYITVLVPMFILLIFAKHYSEWTIGLSKLTKAVLLAVATGPLIWSNAARSLLTNSQETPGTNESAFLMDSITHIINRVFGAVFLYGDETYSSVPVLLFITSMISIGFLVQQPQTRHFWTRFLVGSSAIVIFLSTINYYPYGQQRAVQIVIPLWIFAICAGFGAFRQKLQSNKHLSLNIASAAVIIVFVSTFLFENISTVTNAATKSPIGPRTVDSNFEQAIRWVSSIDPKGSHTLIVNSNYFEQLWLIYSASGLRDVQYPFVYRDYMIIDPFSAWDKKTPRYALVGLDDYVDADKKTVIRQNSRFRLLDLSKGDVLIGVPTANFTDSEAAAGFTPHWMSDNGQLLIIRNAGVSNRIFLIGSALERLSPLPLTITTSAGRVLSRTTVLAERSPVAVDLPNGSPALLTLKNAKPAQSPAPDDPRKLSYNLHDIEIKTFSPNK